jgi:hypothetical protein
MSSTTYQQCTNKQVVVVYNKKCTTCFLFMCTSTSSSCVLLVCVQVVSSTLLLVCDKKCTSSSVLLVYVLLVLNALCTSSSEKLVAEWLTALQGGGLSALWEGFGTRVVSDTPQTTISTSTAQKFL